MHLAQVLQWRNQPRIRQNMYNQQVISPVQHAQWFADLQRDPARCYFVMLQDGKPIGSLNYSDMQQPEWEWGCFIGEHAVWPGSGILLELAALDIAAALGAQRLRAEVLHFNQAPIKLHRFFGYRQLESKIAEIERDGIAHDALVFVYDMDDWRAARPGVLARLPKQVAAAAGNIRFNIDNLDEA
ncbi:MAG TPA: UDP-4-amino-4,6-dideoxy-N-acetyl-beta-L-altrosamine N-acetyltransferase [Herbaspirillum sp.]